MRIEMVTLLNFLGSSVYIKTVLATLLLINITRVHQLNSSEGWRGRSKNRRKLKSIRSQYYCRNIILEYDTGSSKIAERYRMCSQRQTLHLTRKVYISYIATSRPCA